MPQTNHQYTDHETAHAMGQQGVQRGGLGGANLKVLVDNGHSGSTNTTEVLAMGPPSPFALSPRDITPGAAVPSIGDDDAAILLERWEKARIRQDRKRQEQADGQAVEGQGSHDGEARTSALSPMGDSRRNSRLCTPDASQPLPGRRQRRASELTLNPNGLNLRDLLAGNASRHSDTHKIVLSPEPQTAPVATRKTRRNSYSVGYSVNSVDPSLSRLAAGVTRDDLEAASSIRAEPVQRLTIESPTPGTSAKALPANIRTVTIAPDSCPAGSVECDDAYTPTQARTSSHAPFMRARLFIPAASGSTAAAVATPTAASTTAAGDAQSGGIGGKLRRLLGRTASRAALLKPNGFMDKDANGKPRSKGSGTEGEQDVDTSDESAEDVHAPPREGRRPIASSPSFKQPNNRAAQLRPLQTLSPFVPKLLIDEVAAKEGRYQAFDHGNIKEIGKSSADLEPNMYEFQGSIMIADVKGFTQLTEILSKKGTAGVELLTNCMNNYFTKVINMILAFNGDVVKFAGDSMIVAFSPTPAEARGEDQGLKAATHRCAQCAHMLAKQLGHMRMKMNGQVEPIAVAPEPQAEDAGADVPVLARHPTGKRNALRANVSATSPTVVGSQQDLRSMQAIQHAAQQVAGGLHHPTSMDGSQRSQVSPARSEQSNRNSTGSGASTATVNQQNYSHRGSQDGPDCILPALDTADAALANHPASMSVVQGVAGSGMSFTKSKRAHWLSGVMGKKGSTAGFSSAGGASVSSNSSKAGKGPSVDLTAANTGANSNPGSAASSNVPSAANSPNASVASALRGARNRGRTDGSPGLSAGTGNLLGATAKESNNKASNDANMWGETSGGGMVRREMSLASKLNLPPPVRQLPASSGRNSSITPGASFGGLELMNHAPSGALVSFTNEGPTRLGIPNGGRPKPAESWAAKFHTLTTGVMSTQGAGNDAASLIERSNTSLGGPRPVLALPEALQALQVPDEADEHSSPDSKDSIDKEPAGWGGVMLSGPSRSGPSRSRLGMLRPALFTSPRKSVAAPLASKDMPPASGIRSGASSDTPLNKVGDHSPAEGSTPPLISTAPVEWSEDSYDIVTTATDVAAVGPRSNGAGLRRGLGRGMGSGNIDNVNIDGYMAPTSAGQPLGEATEASSSGPSQSPARPRLYAGMLAHSSQTTAAAARRARHQVSEWLDAQVPSLSAPGPVAEGLFAKDTSDFSESSAHYQRNRSSGGNGGSVHEGYSSIRRRPSNDSFKPSFVGKVRSWFATGGSKRSIFSNQESRGDDHDDASQGSESPTQSFAYQPPAPARTPVPGPQYGKTRDPIMEEVQNSEFSLKIMISAGSVCVFQVGGLIDEVTDPTVPEIPHWEYFVADRPLAPLKDQYGRRRCIAQLAAIEDQAGAGEVVGSTEVMDLLEDEWDFDILPDDVGRLRTPVQPYNMPARQSQIQVRMPTSKSIKHRRPAEDTSLSAEDDSLECEDTGECEQTDFAQLPDHIQKRLAGVLRMHVVGSVRSRVEAGHLDFITEIRPLTCLFLGFPSLLQENDTASAQDQVSSVQYCINKVQEVMRKWDGSLLQFRCDEKGFVAICAFGLPGHTHEDNPSRGILASLDLHQRIKLKQHRVCIGVTTGDLLCTCVGARKIRTEYTVFGDAINLSARLMVKCKKGNTGDILCDHPTHSHAKFKAAFEELEPLTVKGKKLPVHVYHVTAFDKETAAINVENRDMEMQQSAARAAGAAERPLVGRDTETSFILNRAANMIAGMATGGAIVIEGNTGMGKTKLLTEVRKSLEKIRADTEMSGKPAFHLLFGVADIANKNSKLHPWRRTFQDLFAVDIASTLQQQLQNPDMMGNPADQLGHDSSSQSMAMVTQLGNRLAAQIPSYNSEWAKHLAELVDLPPVLIPRGNAPAADEFVAPSGGLHVLFADDTPGLAAPPAAQTGQLSSSGLPHGSPMGIRAGTFGSMSQSKQGSGTGPSSAQMGAAAAASGLDWGSGAPNTPRGATGSNNGTTSLSGQEGLMGRALAGALAGIGSLTGNTSMRRAAGQLPPAGPSSVQGSPGSHRRSTLLDQVPPAAESQAPSGDRATMERNLHLVRAASLINTTGIGPSRSLSMRRSPSSMVPGAATALAAAQATMQQSLGPAGASAMIPASMGATSVVATGGGNTAAAPLKKNSLNFLVHVLREFTALYGPIILMFENLHEFDTWSWQLLVKVAEVLSSTVLILATTRPIELASTTQTQQAHGKAAFYQKVATMYRHLLKLPTTSKVHLEPFTFQQTKALMQALADNHLFPDQYVLAVKEKTGGMPLYIEKVTEFLCQKPWLAEQGGEFTATVNKMIRNLNFQQVIIERMDRLKPVIHLTLKVASVMGQWVDLDILYKFYPINHSKEEIRGHLVELERGNFLKPTDTDGVWEFNMVERDIVYEVIPHYQRRRLHAKLAQELEKSLEDQHVATLTTIAYHWNQACMGHEVTEVECALKAIEFWQRAAEAGYSGSSLMEALRLYQKAAQIAELLGDSVSQSFQANNSQRPSLDGANPDLEKSVRHLGGPSTNGGLDTPKEDDMDDNNASFTAIGATFKGPLNWSLVSRITRAQWEKSMASCCLGIVMQHRLEFNNQMEFWDSEDYFELLTEHAIRGLMLLGAPHPQDLLVEDKPKTLLDKMLCCFRSKVEEPSGWQEGVVLQDQEVTEIRDILLVLIIAAEHYSLQQDGEEYVRLLTFCKRVCTFFNKCSDTGGDPFTDIQVACATRIKTFKARRGVAAEFEVSPDKDALGFDTYYMPNNLAANDDDEL